MRQVPRGHVAESLPGLGVRPGPICLVCSHPYRFPASHLPVVATQDGLQGSPELHEGGALALLCVRGWGHSRWGTLLDRGVGAHTHPSPCAVGCPGSAAGWGPRSTAGARALRQQQSQGREDVHVLQNFLGIQQVF